jgi:prephenate dehydrogenase
VKATLAGFRAHLDGVMAALDGDLGAGYFTEANRLRAQLSTAKKGFAVPLSEILVDVEDKPGELVRVFAPLSAAALNVLDVEILKVREGEGGVLMLGFHGDEEAGKALVELSASGFRARVR